MDTCPGGLDQCWKEGYAAEYFSEFDIQYDQLESLEQLLEAVGINDYTRFIRGYHVFGAGAMECSPDLCALNWYGQTSTMRIHNPFIWDHWVITDQACPTQCMHANSFRRQERFDAGCEHKIGVA